MNRLKWSMAVCVFAIVLTPLLLTADVARTAPLTCETWKVVSSPNPGSGGNYLNGVAAVSTNNVWAVGDYLTGSAIARTLIEYWNGSSWKVVPSPNPSSLDNHLTGVARIPGSSNVWAVGDSYMSNRSSRTLAEFYC